MGGEQTFRAVIPKTMRLLKHKNRGDECGTAYVKLTSGKKRKTSFFAISDEDREKMES